MLFYFFSRAGVGVGSWSSWRVFGREETSLYDMISYDSKNFVSLCIPCPCPALPWAWLPKLLISTSSFELLVYTPAGNEYRLNQQP